MKEYNNLVKDGTQESFYVTSNSVVFQKLTNPVDEKALRDAARPDYKAIMAAKKLPQESKEKLQIKSKYRYEQLKKMKYLSYFQIEQLKLKEK